MDLNKRPRFERLASFFLDGDATEYNKCVGPFYSPADVKTTNQSVTDEEHQQTQLPIADALAHADGPDDLGPPTPDSDTPTTPRENDITTVSDDWEIFRVRQIAGKAWHKWGRGVCDFRKYHAKRVVEGTVLREIFSQCKSVLRTRGKFTFKIGITSEVSTRWLSYTEDAKWIPDVMFVLVSPNRLAIRCCLSGSYPYIVGYRLRVLGEL